jgi:hypothetical protein
MSKWTDEGFPNVTVGYGLASQRSPLDELNLRRIRRELGAHRSEGPDDWALVACMLLTIGLLAALYVGFFSLLLPLDMRLPGVILVAVLVLWVST